MTYEEKVAECRFFGMKFKRIWDSEYRAVAADIMCSLVIGDRCFASLRHAGTEEWLPVKLDAQHSDPRKAVAIAERKLERWLCQQMTAIGYEVIK